MHRPHRTHRAVGLAISLLMGIACVPLMTGHASAGECSDEITPTIKAKINRALRDGTEEKIRLNCHDFKIKPRLAFDLGKGGYKLTGKLSHVKRADFDDQWGYGIEISEDGLVWHIRGISDYSLMGRPNPYQGNWEREAKRLINQLGRSAAERIRKHVAVCKGEAPRDDGVERRDHRTNCRLDVPTIGKKTGMTRRPG